MKEELNGHTSTIEMSKKCMVYKIFLRVWRTLFDLGSIIQLSNICKDNFTAFWQLRRLWNQSISLQASWKNFFFLLFLAKQIDNAQWNPSWLKKPFAVMFYMFPLCSFRAETYVNGGRFFWTHADEKIVLRSMHKLAHTQVTEHTITAVFRNQQGTSKWKQNASSQLDHSLTIDSSCGQTMLKT